MLTNNFFDMLKFIVLFLVVALVQATVWSQTVDMGVPKMWSSKHKMTQQVVTFPTVNVAEQLRVDSINFELTQQKVFRFGYEHHTEINLFNQGEQFFAPNGDRYTTLAIACPNALSINLIFDVFELAEGVSLFLYDKEKTHYIGAYTSLNNNEEKVLGTELLESDHIIVEIVEPKEVIGKSSLTIGTVVHGYHDLTTLIEESNIMKNLNSSGGCNYDVNCPEGSGWELQRNSVALILAGGSFCSGALVHNTSGVVIPYFLTARHCGTASIGSWAFRFKWEAPHGGVSCATSANSTDGPRDMTINGATLRASNNNTDFTLVELNNEPDPLWGIYYAGWDNSDEETITQSIGIHHPRGDIKKICISNMAPNKTTINFNGNPTTRMWNVPSWSLGTTEVGSSGSPLFDQNGRVVGVLSGGAAACSGTINNGQYDVYGRLGVAWDEAASENAQLKHWLDPNNTGATVIDGFDPGAPIYDVDAAIVAVGNIGGVVCGRTTQPQVTLLNNGQTDLTSARINYSLNGNEGHYDWTGLLETSQSTLITLPNLSTQEGENTLVVTVVNPNNTTDENPANDSRTLEFLAAGRGEYLTMELNFDCYAEETSWKVIDEEDVVWYFGEGYQNQASPQQSITEDFCLTQGCYTLVVEDSYGDGMLGSVYSQCNHDGSMTLVRDYNDELIAEIDETNVDFGDEVRFDFCVDNLMAVQLHNLENEVSIYPNPASHSFTIAYQGNESQLEYKVYSASGALQVEGSLSQEYTEVQIDQLRKGMYFVKIGSAEGSVVRKLVVQ